MDETPKQYTRRILSHTQGQDPLKTQAATPRKLDRSIRRTPREIAQKARAWKMVSRRNSGAPRRHSNRGRLAHVLHPRCSRK